MNNYWLLLEHVAACELCLFFSSIKSYTVDEINWTWFSLLSWDDMSNCGSCAALASEWEQLIAICIEKKPHNQDNTTSHSKLNSKYEKIYSCHNSSCGGFFTLVLFFSSFVWPFFLFLFLHHSSIEFHVFGIYCRFYSSAKRESVREICNE